MPNCKPGKTVPCGKVCRQPANCKQKNATQPAANQTRSFKRQSPTEKWNAIASNPKTAKFVELMSGRKLSDKKMREELGVDQDGLLKLANSVYNRLGLDRTKDLRTQMKALKKSASSRKDSLIYRIDSLLEDLIDV